MASDLGMNCLLMSHKKDARLMWVKSKKGGNDQKSILSNTTSDSGHYTEETKSQVNNHNKKAKFKQVTTRMQETDKRRHTHTKHK